MLIVRVVGARPQFMQVPLLQKQLEKLGHAHFLLHTGQHYDYEMSDIFFTELGIPKPDINLQVGSGTHGKTTGEMIAGIEKVLIEINPDAILLDGDTNSTLAGAIAATKLHIPIIHVEAGLRDWDRTRPEEINRILTDHASDLNCAPIPRALENLKHEGLEQRSVLTGDLLLDCFLHFQMKADDAIFQNLALKFGQYHLATVHRQENTKDVPESRFYEILKALANLDKQVILVLHPRVKKLYGQYIELGYPCGNIRPVAPISYFQILSLMQNCDCVLTDSGGLSREAVWSGKRCVMLFQVDTLEDFLEKRWAQIGKEGSETILSAFDRATPAPSLEAIALFGGGVAAENIACEINSKFAS